MIIGHYATALIPYSRHAKTSLLLFLIAANLNDLLWLVFASVGLEPTSPRNIVDTSFQNLQVVMTYSHDVVPTLVWALVMAGIGYAISKERAVALWCGALVILHLLCDLAAGYEHNVMGPNSMVLGTAMYRTSPYLALVIEMVFGGLCVLAFVAMEKRQGRPVSAKRQAVLFGVFIGGVALWLPTAATPMRELFAYGCYCHPSHNVASLVCSFALALCVWPVLEEPHKGNR